MILVDSSVWISYFRADGSEKIRSIIKDAIYNDLVAVNGIIIVEVLSGISRKNEYEKVKSDFKGFHFLNLSEKDFLDASLIGTNLRKKGITIPPTDLIIAASSINNGAILYHLDKHFDLISKHTKLQCKNLLPLS
ncbi:MAG: PIN domain nuclease [Nitrospirae bacterium]|nr:PIN domain nuclease [Nitrospirota bacterium]